MSKNKKITIVLLCLGISILLILLGILIINKPDDKRYDDTMEDVESSETETSIENESEENSSEEETEPKRESNSDLTNVKVGDQIYFGVYPKIDYYAGEMTHSNELYPIVWDVIDIVDNKALLLSHYILDYKPYNETEDRPVWEQCSLRKWLNTEFYDTAFDSYEKMSIHTQDVDNSSLNCFDTDGGPDTQDKVYILSFNEYTTYWTDYDDRAKGKVYSEDFICGLFRTDNVTPDIIDEEEFSKADIWGVGEAYSTKTIGREYAAYWLRSSYRETQYYSGYDTGGQDYGSDNLNPYWGLLHCSGLPGVLELGVRPAIWVEIER